MFANWPHDNHFTFTVRIYARYSEAFGGIVVEATTNDFSRLDDFILLHEEEHSLYTGEFSLAQEDIVNEAGKALDQKLQKLRAEHYSEESELLEQINSLKSLTHQPQEDE